MLKIKLLLHYPLLLRRATCEVGRVERLKSAMLASARGPELGLQLGRGWKKAEKRALCPPHTPCSPSRQHSPGVRDTCACSTRTRTCTKLERRAVPVRTLVPHELGAVEPTPRIVLCAQSLTSIDEIDEID